MRALALAFAALLTACTFDAPGRCTSDSDCAAGLSCGAGNVCTGCTADSQCATWQSCSASRTCVAQAGRCAAATDCAAWQTCDATNTCALAPGKCDADAQCTSWQSCSNHTCMLLPGRCDTDAQCPWPLSCDSGHTCGTNFSPDEVLYQAHYSNQGDVFARAAAMDRPFAGVDSSYAGGYIDPSGRIVYKSISGNFEIRRFTFDGFVFANGYWNFPTFATAIANDVVLVSESATCLPYRFVMHPVTGDILYDCQYTDTDWYDTSGVKQVAGHTLVAWNADDFKLADDPGGLQLLSPSGTAIPVTGLSGATRLAFRSHGAGFWVAVTGELWFIDETGVAAKVGSFAPAPAGTVPDSLPPAALEGSGALVQLADATTGLIALDKIIRRPLDPATSSLLWDQATAPLDDMTKTPPVVHGQMVGRAFITGP